MKILWLVSAFLATCSIGCMAELDGSSLPLDEEDISSFAAESLIISTCMDYKQRASGYTNMSVSSGGIMRSFLLYVPTGYTPIEPYPLVLNLHGSGSNPAQQMAISELAPLADARGYVVAAPQAIDGYWNVPVDPAKPDDVQFISDVIDKVSEYLCIDSARIYATGFSGGGRMVSQLGCDIPYRFAAIAPVGGLRFPVSCTDSKISIISFHGTADPINPYDGGGPSYWQTSVPDACSGWAEHNACDTNVAWTSEATSVARLWYECDMGHEDVELYRIDGFGHQWPGSSIDTGFGAQTEEISASELMMSFFAAHSKLESTYPPYY